MVKAEAEARHAEEQGGGGGGTSFRRRAASKSFDSASGMVTLHSSSRAVDSGTPPLPRARSTSLCRVSRSSDRVTDGGSTAAFR